MRRRLLAAAATVAVAASLLAFQPLRSPWWTGYDFDSVYVGVGLTLFRGDRTNFYDHPGSPLGEGLGATFTGAWLVSGGGNRHDRAEEWISDLDSTRPYLRVFASLVFVLSTLIAFFSIAWVTRSAWWGLLGGLLFLSAPDLITWAAVVKPDPLLAGLTVASLALLAEAFRRRAAPLYLAAAFVLGYDVSVKVQAAGLVVPFVLAGLWRPPRPGWWKPFTRDTRAWLRAHRRAVAITAGIWLTVVVVLNALSAPPALKPLAEVAGGTVALAGVSWAGWHALRPTRLAGVAGVTIGSLFALLAGLVVPNLFYASVPAPMVRQAAITLTGGGVNTGAHPTRGAWGVLDAWHLFILVAAIGLAYALTRREWEALTWASGATMLGVLAYLRFGEIHYYTAAIAAAAPLVLRALQAVPAARIAVSALVVAAVLWQPYRDGIDAARGRGREATKTERVNAWVAARLRQNDVALTNLEASDARFFHLVHFYAQWAPEPNYRFLPTDAQGAEWVREHGKRVGFVLPGTATDVDALLRSLELPGRAHRERAAPGLVYRVEPA